MNKQMLEVMRRRSELQAKIAAQRGQLAEICVRWQPALTIADQAVAAVRFIRIHPVLAGSVTALLLVRRRGVFGLVSGGWRIWKGYRILTNLAAKLTLRPDQI